MIFITRDFVFMLLAVKSCEKLTTVTIPRTSLAKCRAYHQKIQDGITGCLHTSLNQFESTTTSGNNNCAPGDCNNLFPFPKDVNAECAVSAFVNWNEQSESVMFLKYFRKTFVTNLVLPTAVLAIDSAFVLCLIC